MIFRPINIANIGYLSSNLKSTTTQILLSEIIECENQDKPDISILI